MKQLLLTLGLAAVTVAGAHADGTFMAPNSAIRRITVDVNSDGTPDRFATAEDGFRIYYYFGLADSLPQDLTALSTFGVIGNVPGVITGMSLATPIPFTQGGQVVSLQVRIESDSGWHAESKVIQVALGPDIGPGTVIWGTYGGVEGPNRIVSLTAVGGPPILISSVPEPSTLALGALGGLMLLFRVRKSMK